MKPFSAAAWSKMFFVAALWNFGFALPGLFMPAFNITLAFGPENVPVIMNSFHTYAFYNFVWAFVLLMGIGYYVVSRDVTKNRGIVFLGIIGKLFFFFYFSYMFFTAHAALPAFLGVLGDLGFSIVFGMFLLRTRGSAKA